MRVIFCFRGENIKEKNVIWGRFFIKREFFHDEVGDVPVVVDAVRQINFVGIISCKPIDFFKNNMLDLRMLS
ncbi:MAG: hypothetical protein NT149_04775 [Candidatus Gottesmanbacteria bacterium]|nr:hypothetical protein [Candidatus Gottesmanbacteria bacterium]